MGLISMKFVTDWRTSFAKVGQVDEIGSDDYEYAEDDSGMAETLIEAGTWEEKNLNKWASDRIKELLQSVDSLEFSGGRADITEVSKCVGDAFLVTVRKKKCVGYTYELTLRVKGEWFIGEEKKKIKGYIDLPEFSFGELDDLQIDVRLGEEKDLLHQDKLRISKDLKLFLQPLCEKLRQFEQELKER
ncbi:unnamed protein product [Ilex paraguariensis]|uniref:Activator of Hsp90 ATPase AHSA1-like N-terminal domain-containing protein n=1 Tax=Ilex paraguariensis TaxID=185542 RepID=A0ABC8RA19_9AQUA